MCPALPATHAHSGPEHVLTRRRSWPCVWRAGSESRRLPADPEEGEISPAFNRAVLKDAKVAAAIREQSEERLEYQAVGLKGQESEISRYAPDRESETGLSREARPLSKPGLEEGGTAPACR